VDAKIKMDEFKLNRETLQDGVYILSEINDEFETIYLKVREKEKRIYSDEELIKLPFASETNPHKKEWDLRTKSFLRFKDYIVSKKEKINILDLGCGNGWFSGQLSKSFTNNFFCVDFNLTELKQGRKVFNSEQIKFVYADIFTAEIPKASFDIITMNAAVQYFPELNKLINRLSSFLNENGEVHILDSPFYSKSEAVNAKKRTMDYYSALGFPEMAGKYFHHTWNELSEFKNEILFRPDSVTNRVKRLFSETVSPFHWIKITQ
jgi:ubiquinone/menaquinone biosynthesis C-methylase UbiE